MVGADGKVIKACASTILKTGILYRIKWEVLSGWITASNNPYQVKQPRLRIYVAEKLSTIEGHRIGGIANYETRWICAMHSSSHCWSKLKFHNLKSNSYRIYKHVTRIVEFVSQVNKRGQRWPWSSSRIHVLLAIQLGPVKTPLNCQCSYVAASVDRLFKKNCWVVIHSNGFYCALVAHIVQ